MARCILECTDCGNESHIVFNPPREKDAYSHDYEIGKTIAEECLGDCGTITEHEIIDIQYMDHEEPMDS